MQAFNNNQPNSDNQYNIQLDQIDPNMRLKNDIKRYTDKLNHTRFMIDRCVEEEKYELAAELNSLSIDLEVLINKLKNQQYE